MPGGDEGSSVFCPDGRRSGGRKQTKKQTNEGEVFIKLSSLLSWGTSSTLCLRSRLGCSMSFRSVEH